MTIPKSEAIKELRSIGYQREFVVEFTKVNGEVRQMKAMMEIPDKPVGPLEDLSAVPVMDLEKGQWRSFRLDSILSISA